MEKSVAEPILDASAANMREPVEIIAQINKLTQKNKVLWHSVNKETPPGHDNNLRIQACYEAEYRGHTLRLTCRQTKHYSEPGSLFFASALRRKYVLSRDEDTGRAFYRRNELLLELIAPNGVVVWSPKYVSILEGLRASIQYQLTNPAYKNFVTEIFAEG